MAPVLAVQASACVARSVSSQEQGARASFQSRQSLMAGRASMVVVRSAGVEPSGAPAGQITSELMLSMKQKIGEALETQEVSVPLGWHAGLQHSGLKADCPTYNA